MLLCVALLGVAAAVVIPEGKPDSLYTSTDPAVAYPAVFPYDALNRPAKVPGECAATVVHPRYAVTAAHCFSDISSRATAQIQATVGGSAFTTVGVLIDPCWSFSDDGPNSHDLALLKFGEDLPVAPVEMRTTAGEAGQEFTMVGWGDTGTSAQAQSDISPCNEGGGCQFRVAKNVFTAAGAGLLKYTFDDPSAGGLPLEGLAYTGDSGGPAFIGSVIVGVNSGGGCCAFGSEDQYCRLADKADWISEAIRTGAAPAISDCSAFAIPTTTTTTTATTAAAEATVTETIMPTPAPTPAPTAAPPTPVGTPSPVPTPGSIASNSCRKGAAASTLVAALVAAQAA